MTRLAVFLMVLEIFKNESVNSIFKYKLKYKFKYKLFAVAKYWFGKITEFLR